MDRTGSRGWRVALPGIAAVVLIAVVGLSYREWRQYNRANVEAAQTRAIVDSVGQFLFTLVDAETEQRGYLLTGENRYLQPYNQAVQAIPGEITGLGKLLARHPERSGSVARLNDLADQELADLQQAIELRRAQGAAPAAALVLSDHSKRTMDAIRAICAEIQRRENAAQMQTSLEGEAAAGTALVASVAGSLLLLFLFAFGLEPLASPDPQAQRRSWPLRYGAAVLAVVAVVLFRMALTPLMGDRSMPFTLFFPAVWFAAWYGGLRPGVVSVALSALAGDYFFAEPAQTLLIRYHDDQIAMLMLVIVGFGMALLSRSQQRAVARAAQAENAERNERQRFETTLASIGDAVMASDTAGRVSYLNPVAERLTGWNIAEASGQPLEDVFRIINEESRRAVENPVSKVLRMGQVVGLANHTMLIARDGKEFAIDDSAAPIRDARGGVTGVVLVFRDVTEKRVAELQAEERRLELLVKEQALASEKATREMEAELARVLRAMSVNELASSIAHEVNQPLAGVVTNADAGIRWLNAASPDVDEAKRSLALIARDANLASAVIQRIREFLRKEEPETTPLNLNGIIDEAVTLLASDLERRGIELRTDLARDLPLVRGDRVQLQQVIVNLLMNGAEAMTATTERKTLAISTRRSAEGVLVSVSDSGAGISPQDMSRMFQAFFTTKPSGMGMGLSISRSIMEAHGGRIWAQANQGPGITVSFTLPAEKEGAETYRAGHAS